MKVSPRAVLLALAAPLLAIVVAFVITSLVLVAAGDPVELGPADCARLTG